MNLGLVSTGLYPLVIGSVELFQLDAWLNKLPWDVSGGSVTIFFADPNGVQTSFAALIVTGGYGAMYSYAVVGPASVDANGVRLLNPWRRAWLVVDVQGRKQKSRPISFDVISSPA